MLAPGQAYSESQSTAFGESVQKRADKAHGDYHETAKKLDAKLGTHADPTGSVETEMNSCNSGRVSGFGVGAFGEVSMQVRDLADLATYELNAEHLALFDDAMGYERELANVYTADPPLDWSSRTPRMGRTASRQMLRPCPGPTAAAYSHTRYR